MTMSGRTLTGPEVFQFLQHPYGLKIQRDTGLRHSRGSLLKSARKEYGVQSRTIAGAVAEMEAMRDA